MQQLIGRLTTNAKVAQLKDGREVVNFSIAMNDSYKPKGASVPTKLVTYVDCAYWLSPNIASLLTKGSLIEVFGRIGVRAYASASGEVKGTLTCHVSVIKLHGQTKQAEKADVPVTATNAQQVVDDLPF